MTLFRSGFIAGAFLWGALLPAAAAQDYLNYSPGTNPFALTPAPISSNIAITGGTGSVSVLNPGTLNGIYGTGGGTLVDMCRGQGGGYNYGCPAGGIGSILSQFAVVTTASLDASQQQTGLYAYLYSNGGYASIWSATTAYAANAITRNGANLYKTASSCTSGSSGGPTGTTTSADGTCSWVYVGPQYTNAKQAFGFITDLDTNAGNGWGIAGGVFPRAGWHGQFAAGAEIDATNPTATDADGTQMTIDAGFFPITTGANPITRGIHINASVNGTLFGTHDALLMSGNYLAKDNDVHLTDLHSTNGWYDTGAHTGAGLHEASTTPVGLFIDGTYSTAGIFFRSGAATTAISIPANSSLCHNAFAACEVWNGSVIAIGAPETITGDLNVIGASANGGVFINNAGSLKTWELATVTGAGGSFLVYDVGNARSPLVAQSGALNNDLVLTAGGAIFGGNLTAASLPTAGGTVKGSLCVDTTGLVYVKTTTGACL